MSIYSSCKKSQRHTGRRSSIMLEAKHIHHLTSSEDGVLNICDTSLVITELRPDCVLPMQEQSLACFRRRRDSARCSVKGTTRFRGMGIPTDALGLVELLARGGGTLCSCPSISEVTSVMTQESWFEITRSYLKDFSRFPRPRLYPHPHQSRGHRVAPLWIAYAVTH